MLVRLVQVRRPVAIVLGVLTLFACGGGSDPTPPPPPPPEPVASLDVSPSSAILIPQQSTPLTATPRAASGAALAGRPVTWSTSAGAVATVSGSGEVTAVGPGNAEITATSEGKSARAVIEVREGMMIGAAGGTVSADGGNVTIAIPPGALSGTLPISIARINNPPNPTNLRAPVAYEFGPDGTQFTRPVLLTLKYQSSGLDSLQALLRVTRLTNGKWVPLPSGEVNGPARTVVAPTSSFSSYSLGYPLFPAQVVITPSNPSIYVGQSIGLSARVLNGDGEAMASGPFGPGGTVHPVFWSGDAGISLDYTDRLAIVTGRLHGDIPQVVGAHIQVSIECRALGGGPKPCYYGEFDGHPVQADSIQFTYGGSARVLVRRVPVRSVQVTPGTAVVTAGETVQLVATPRDSAGGPLTDRPVTWTSGDVTKAVVSPTGLVTTIVSGSVPITATSEGIAGAATLTIETSTKPVVGVQVTAPTDSVEAGGALQLVAIGRDALGNAITGRPTTWTSLNPSVASVSPTGLVTGVIAGGPVAIRATIDGIVGGRSITVTAPVPLVHGTPTTGDRFTCFVRDNGTTWCWGRGTSGELGIGTTPATQSVPIQVTAAPPFVAIAAGGTTTLGPNPERYHACGVTASGQAWCWGANDVGQLGDGTKTQRDVPTAVGGGLNFARLAVGATLRTCGLTTGGEAWCWGASPYGHGNPAISNRTAPTRIQGTNVFTRIAAAQFVVCALDGAGAAWCWGSEFAGEMGDGDDAIHIRDQPHPVVGGHRFTDLTAGTIHVCGLKADGTVWCWGRNSVGALGDGTTVTRTAPVAVQTPVRFAAISAGGESTCGIATDGSVWCWGDRTVAGGGLGLPSFYPTPVKLPLARTFTSISASSGHACGHANDGIWCWGLNTWGQLGNGALSQVPVGPVKVVFPQ